MKSIGAKWRPSASGIRLEPGFPVSEDIKQDVWCGESQWVSVIVDSQVMKPIQERLWDEIN